MSTSTGMRVCTVTVTWLDGRQQTWTDVRWRRQPMSVVLQRAEGSVIEVFFHAMQCLEWTLPEGVTEGGD